MYEFKREPLYYASRIGGLPRNFHACVHDISTGVSMMILSFVRIQFHDDFVHNIIELNLRNDNTVDQEGEINHHEEKEDAV